MSEKKLPLTLEQTLECIKKTLKEYKRDFEAIEKYICCNDGTPEEYILGSTEEAYKHIAKYRSEKINSLEEFWDEIVDTIEGMASFYNVYTIDDCEDALYILSNDIDCDWKELREACEWFGVDSIELENIRPDFLATIYAGYCIELELERFFDSVKRKCKNLKTL
jgi:hypothetical protein